MNDKLNIKISTFSILKFTLPSIIMMVVMSLYSIIDGMFVARFINTDAFSATNIIYPMGSVIIALGTMFGTGVSAVVAKKLGEGKKTEANQVVTFITIIATIISIIITVLCLVFIDDIIRLLGANDNIFQYCKDYASMLFIFFPAGLLQLLCQSLFVANGKPMIGLIVTLVGGVANVVLDYVFIVPLNMGIAGAAIATGIGYCVPAVFGIFYFWLKPKLNLHFVRPKFMWRELFNTCTNGSSEMVSCLATSVTTILFNLIMMRLIGEDGVAAVAVILYIDFVLVAIMLGYSIGVAPLISYNYGSLQNDRLKKLFKFSVKFCAIISVFVTIFSILLSSQLAGLFTTKGTYVYELAVTGIKLYAISYLFKGFNVFSSALFTAFSNGKVSALLSFLRTLVFLVICLIGFTALFNVTGVWIASPVAEFLAFIVSVICVLKFRKKYNYA